MAPGWETVSGNNYDGARKIPYQRMPERTRMVELHDKHLFIARWNKKKN